MPFIALASIFFFASFIQGAAGFSFGLLIIPLLVWADFSLAEASFITSINAFVLSSIMVYRLRKHVKWRFLGPTILLRLVTVSIGVLLLSKLNNLDKTLIRQLLGALLLLIVMIQLSIKPKVKEKLHPAWWWLAFGSSGFFAGLVGFGGPPTVLWIMTQNWSNNETRAVLAALYWSILPLQLALLLFAFGQPLFMVSRQALGFVPVAVLGVFMGIVLGNKLAKHKLRQLAYFILLVTALMSLLAPFFS